MADYVFNNDPEVSWEIIRTADGIAPVVRELLDQKMFAWDVETNGLSVWQGAKIVGHGFAWRRPSGQIKSVYFPCRHQTAGRDMFEDMTQIDPAVLSKELEPALGSPALKYGHNIKFDIHFGRADGINVQGQVHDSIIAAKLMDENQKGYALKQVLAREKIPHQVGWKKMINSALNRVAKDLQMKVSELKDRYGYAYVPIDICGNYCCQDCVYEFRLGEYQIPFQHQWAELWEMEMKLIWAIIRMEEKGVPLNAPHLEQLEAEHLAIMNELAPQIWSLAGEEFEITNDNALRKILFQKLGLPSKGKTKKDKLDRVDDDVLWELETNGSQICGLIRKYNDSQKIASTYTRSILDLADANGIIHAEIDQSGAATGRFSCSQPNLQNIPVRTPMGRRVREAFVVRPGMFRYCLDYSQIELRILAHLSQDPILLRVYRDGLDVHRTTALEAFGTADKVDGVDMRRVAKILNFGIPFGITEFGVQKNINKDLPEGVEPITEQKATGYLESWYRKYAGVNAYRKSLWYQVEQNSGLFWNMFGRPRRIPYIASQNEWARKSAQRKITSTMVQGSAADLVKHCMVACDEYMVGQQDCEAAMVLMIHDDLQFDVMPEGSARFIRDIKGLMESTCQHRMSVPVVTDVEYFDESWGKKKELKC